MAIRLSATLIMPAAIAAAVAAFLLLDRAPAATPVTTAAPDETAAVGADQIPGMPGMGEATGQGEQELPPNHPPIGGMAPGQPGPGSDEVAEGTLEWRAPAEWSVAPSTSSMRLATYRVGDATELTVVRAGGSTDANIARWQGQFEGSPISERKERMVHGMKVTVVHIAGTFGAGMGMTPGAPSEGHAGWTMLAAIVEQAGSSYFFKMLGPSTQVDRARPAFEHMLDGLTTRATQ